MEQITNKEYIDLLANAYINYNVLPKFTTNIKIYRSFIGNTYIAKKPKEHHCVNENSRIYFSEGLDPSCLTLPVNISRQNYIDKKFDNSVFKPAINADNTINTSEYTSFKSSEFAAIHQQSTDLLLLDSYIPDLMEAIQELQPSHTNEQFFDFMLNYYKKKHSEFTSEHKETLQSLREEENRLDNIWHKYRKLIEYLVDGRYMMELMSHYKYNESDFKVRMITDATYSLSIKKLDYFARHIANIPENKQSFFEEYFNPKPDVLYGKMVNTNLVNSLKQEFKSVEGIGSKIRDFNRALQWRSEVIRLNEEQRVIVFSYILKKIPLSKECHDKLIPFYKDDNLKLK